MLLRSFAIYAILIIAVPCLCSCSNAQSRFYVSPSGSDSWSGTLETPNHDKTDGPFATVQKARDAVRDVLKKDASSQPVQIVLKEGTYSLDQTLTLGPDDSPAQSNPVVYSAQPGKTVVLSGARHVKSFKPYKGKIMQASLSSQLPTGLKVRDIYYKGTRQHLARVPNFEPKDPFYSGFAFTTGEVNEPNAVKLKYDPAVIKPASWTNIAKATLDIFPGYNYGNRRIKINGADLDDNVLKIDRLDYRPLKGDRFFVENVFEELDAPGEWYFDDSSNTLYFWPPDQDLAAQGVLIPVIDSLIAFNGAHDIEFSGITLQHCNGSAVSMKDTQRCVIAGCFISDTREKAVDLVSGCRSNKIISCDITRTGDYAICLTAPLFEHAKCSQNIISNNHIYDFGKVLKEIAAVGILGGGENTVSNNLIHDGPRWGVFINSGAKNIIEFNHIYNMSLETEDTGAIYLGTAHCGWIPNLDPEKNKLHRGNVIRHNLIHDTLGYGMTGWWTTKKGTWNKPYYSWSIYLDLGASGTTIYGNICYNSHLGGLMLGTVDNIAENNIFVGGKVAQVCTIKWEPPTPKPEITVHFPSWGNRIERNIISYSQPGSFLYWFVYQYGSKWEPNEFYFNNNLIFSSGQELKLQADGNINEKGQAWKAWLSRGMDTNSILADPMFVDPEKHDYRLKPGSPAFKLGFKPIPVEKIGLYTDSYRKKLSVQ